MPRQTRAGEEEEEEAVVVDMGVVVPEMSSERGQASAQSMAEEQAEARREADGMSLGRGLVELDAESRLVVGVTSSERGQEDEGEVKEAGQAERRMVVSITMKGGMKGEEAGAGIETGETVHENETVETVTVEETEIETEIETVIVIETGTEIETGIETGTDHETGIGSEMEEEIVREKGVARTETGEVTGNENFV